MGRATLFRRRSPAPPRRRAGPWIGTVRTLLLLALLLVIGALMDPALIKPRGPLAGQPGNVGDRFTVCGIGRGHACVVDGDTFRLGERRIRIVGIDAPELGHAQCPAEAALAVKARDRLRGLLNQGRFTMTAHRLRRTDTYGRELMTVERGDTDIGQLLVDEGLAHRYFGSKGNWC